MEQDKKPDYTEEIYEPDEYIVKSDYWQKHVEV